MWYPMCAECAPREPHTEGVWSVLIGRHEATKLSRRTVVSTRNLVWVHLGLVLSSVALGDPPFAVYEDAAGDAALRRMDPGGDGVCDLSLHPLIDLLEIRIGRWEPLGDDWDLFNGEFDDDGEFLRLDLVLDGLVNPPGDTDPDHFEPFKYGDRPVYGFVEIDVDNDVATGGELDAPQYRYLGNVVRFGGKPSRAEFADRVAIGGDDFDGDFLTPPFVERHGEEFHLALLGRELVDDIEAVVGDVDEIFEEGETWIIEGEGFHRAHGFEPFSIMEEFEPRSTVQFRHDPVMDATTVSLVFPLGEEEEKSEPCEEAEEETILGGLCDLVESAILISMYPTGLPEEEILIGWAEKEAADYLDPADWSLTVLLGTSYTQPDPSGEYFAWCDVYPDVIRGDAGGDGKPGPDDVALIEQFILDQDSTDGVVDGQVVIPGFSLDFAVFDVNHNGIVDAIDVLLVSLPGDADNDGDVDLLDFGRMQDCFSGEDVPYSPAECALCDFDADADVDTEDFVRFQLAVTGVTGE